MTPKRVYVAHFVSRRGKETFIKIGVSGYGLQQRFALDLVNYKVALIVDSRYYTTDDALIVESVLHDRFRLHAFRPSIKLASGNTECFAFSDGLVSKIVATMTDRALDSLLPKPRSIHRNVTWSKVYPKFESDVIQKIRSEPKFQSDGLSVDDGPGGPNRSKRGARRWRNNILLNRGEIRTSLGHLETYGARPINGNARRIISRK